MATKKKAVKKKPTGPVKPRKKVSPTFYVKCEKCGRWYLFRRAWGYSPKPWTDIGHVVPIEGTENCYLRPTAESEGGCDGDPYEPCCDGTETDEPEELADNWLKQVLAS
jgi:hypothetical protein